MMNYPESPRGFFAKYERGSCVIEFGGRILLLHRRKHTYQGDKWGIPTVRFLAGQNIVREIASEVQHETGYVMKGEMRLAGRLFLEHPYCHVHHFYHHRPSVEPVVNLHGTEHDAVISVLPQDAFSLNLVDHLADFLNKLFTKPL